MLVDIQTDTLTDRQTGWSQYSASLPERNKNTPCSYRRSNSGLTLTVFWKQHQDTYWWLTCFRHPIYPHITAGEWLPAGFWLLHVCIDVCHRDAIVSAKIFILTNCFHFHRDSPGNQVHFQ